MSNNLKKILTTGAALLMFAGVGAGAVSSNHNVHADDMDKEDAEINQRDEDEEFGGPANAAVHDRFYAASDAAIDVSEGINPYTDGNMSSILSHDQIAKIIQRTKEDNGNYTPSLSDFQGNGWLAHDGLNSKTSHRKARKHSTKRIKRVAKKSTKRNNRKHAKKTVKRSKRTNRIRKHVIKRTNRKATKRGRRSMKRRNRKAIRRPVKKNVHHNHRVYLKNAYHIGKNTGKKEYSAYGDIPSLGGSAKILTNKNVFNNTFDKGYVLGFGMAAAKGGEEERPNPEIAIKLAKAYQSSKNKMYKQGIADEFNMSGRKPSRKVRSNHSYKQGHNYAEKLVDDVF